jgi:hypothetical protein
MDAQEQSCRAREWLWKFYGEWFPCVLCLKLTWAIFAESSETPLRVTCQAGAGNAKSQYVIGTAT